MIVRTRETVRDAPGDKETRVETTKLSEDGPVTIVEQCALVQGILQTQLRKDLRRAAQTLTPQNVRLLIDLYYQIQRQPIRLANTVDGEAQNPVPLNQFIEFLYASHIGLEQLIVQAMEAHTRQSRPGRWLLSQYGVGPVIAAGLLAHLLPGGIPAVVGPWWRLAGQDPSSVWYSTEKAEALVKAAFVVQEDQPLTLEQVQAVTDVLSLNGYHVYGDACTDEQGRPRPVTLSVLATVLTTRYGVSSAAKVLREVFGAQRVLTIEEVDAFARSVGRKGARLYHQAGHDRTGKPQPVTSATLAAALAKRPWNTQLRVLCWKVSTSFVRFHGRPDCYYGRIWATRKDQEVARNAAGHFAAEAAKQLRERRYRADTETRKAYERGELPAGHLQARAQRYTAKFLLSHLHYVCFEDAYGKPPPAPWPIAFLDNHSHFVPPPGWPCA